VDNLHQVTPDLYRSGQPKERDIPVLRDLGIRSILNLREWHSDEDVVGGAGFTLYRVAMNAGEMSETQLVEVLTILRDCPKPVLVHCWHGSDRTGCVVALYRMVFQGWPRERAVDEFRNGGFGYHQSVYPQIEEYLSTVDVAALKQKLKPAEGRERGTP
jgi:protein tyrosine/serine phosphatase